jgi:hypothetical protein
MNYNLLKVTKNIVTIPKKSSSNRLLLCTFEFIIQQCKTTSNWHFGDNKLRKETVLKPIERLHQLRFCALRINVMTR